MPSLLKQKPTNFLSLVGVEQLLVQMLYVCNLISGSGRGEERLDLPAQTVAPGPRP